MTAAVVLRAGQVWVPTRIESSAEQRRIAFVGAVPGCHWWPADDARVGYLEPKAAPPPSAFKHGSIKWHSHCEPISMRRWIARHNAQLQPETADA